MNARETLEFMGFDAETIEFLEGFQKQKEEVVLLNGTPILPRQIDDTPLPADLPEYKPATFSKRPLGLYYRENLFWLKHRMTSKQVAAALYEIERYEEALA